MLIPFLSKFVFLGHGLFITPPKPFSVCFLFKYCISHQKASQQSLSPGLISATGKRDAVQTQGGSRWGGASRRQEAGQGGRGSISCPLSSGMKPCDLMASWSLLSPWRQAPPFGCIFLPLLGDLFACSSLQRISSQAIYGDFIAPQRGFYLKSVIDAPSDLSSCPSLHPSLLPQAT